MCIVHWGILAIHESRVMSAPDMKSSDQCCHSILIQVRGIFQAFWQHFLEQDSIQTTQNRTHVTLHLKFVLSPEVPDSQINDSPLSNCVVLLSSALDYNRART